MHDHGTFLLPDLLSQRLFFDSPSCIYVATKFSIPFLIVLPSSLHGSFPGVEGLQSSRAFDSMPGGYHFSGYSLLSNCPPLFSEYLSYNSNPSNWCRVPHFK